MRKALNVRRLGLLTIAGTVIFLFLFIHGPAVSVVSTEERVERLVSSGEFMGPIDQVLVQEVTFVDGGSHKWSETEILEQHPVPGGMAAIEEKCSPKEWQSIRLNSN